MKKMIWNAAKNFVLLAVLFFAFTDVCYGATQGVLQSTAVVKVTGAQTNATVNVERKGKVTLDATDNTIAGTYSWKFLEGPENVRLFASDSLSPYFRPSKPGVYRFTLEINDESDETKEITLEIRDLYFVKINRTSFYLTGIKTYSIGYPMEWRALDVYGLGGWDEVSRADTWTTSESHANIDGSAELHTVTLQCQNVTTGKKYEGTQLEKNGKLEFSFNVALQVGDNLIEVTGVNDRGVTCHDARFIVYNPWVTFVKHLELSQGSVVVGEEDEIKFSLQANFKEGYPIPEKFDLYETTASEEFKQKVGELKLKGAPEQGIYSTILTLGKIAIDDKFYREDKFYRAVLEDGQKSISCGLTFYAQSFPNRQRKANFLSDIISSARREVINKGAVNDKVKVTQEELDRRVERVAEIINDHEEVKYVYIREGGTVVRIMFTTGLETGFQLRIVDAADKIGESVTPPSSEDISIVNSKQIMSLHPFIGQNIWNAGWGNGVGGYDLYYGIKDLFLEHPNFSKSYTAILKDICIDHYREGVQKSDVFFISSHGTPVLIESGVDASRFSTQQDEEDSDPLRKQRLALSNEVWDIVVEKTLDYFFT